LTERPNLPYLGEQVVIAPSTAGTLRNPNNFGKQWRTVRQISAWRSRVWCPLSSGLRRRVKP